MSQVSVYVPLCIHVHACTCARVHAHTYSCMWMQAHTWMTYLWRPEDNLGVISHLSPFLTKDLLLTTTYTRLTGTSVWKVSCSHLPSHCENTGITVVFTTTHNFTWVPGIQNQVFTLMQQALYPQSISQAPQSTSFRWLGNLAIFIYLFLLCSCIEVTVDWRLNGLKNPANDTHTPDRVIREWPTLALTSLVCQPASLG